MQRCELGHLCACNAVCCRKDTFSLSCGISSFPLGCDLVESFCAFLFKQCLLLDDALSMPHPLVQLLSQGSPVFLSWKLKRIFTPS